MTVTGTASVYRTRPKYITLTSAHHWVPGRAAAGIPARNRIVARPPGVIRNPCVQGASDSQLPNDETSCASPRISDASPLASSTASSAVPPGGSRSSGVSTVRPSSAAVATAPASIIGSSSSSGRYRSGAPGPPACTTAVSSITWPRSSEIWAAMTYRPAGVPGRARTVTSQPA